MNYTDIEIWPLLAGLGLFLFGMYMLEEALKAMAGRSFKKFLSKHTNNPIKAVLSGALVTALLQSSSMVSLLVMSFTGAGIIGLKNGVGMIFGANIGTTLTGWLVATLGFKLDIQNLIMPFLAIGGLGIVFLKTEKLAQFSKFLMGFSFMFLGLDFMKTGFADFALHADLSFLQSAHPVVFLLTGILLAAAIQSSSGAMMIFMSSLAAGIITLHQGFFLIIGADLGTTITALMGTIKANPLKKKVGWSHVSFNVLTAVITLVFMNVYAYVIADILNIHDPLIALASFHTLFNIVAVIVLLPFIGLFTKAVDRLFGTKKDNMAMVLAMVNPKESHAAIDALGKETINFMHSGIWVNRLFFDIDGKPDGMPASYFDLKKYEAEITEFYLQLQQGTLNADEAKKTDNLVTIIRNTTLSVKDTKDIMHNLAALQQSGNDHLFALYSKITEQQRGIYMEVEQLLQNISLVSADDITNIETLIHQSHISNSEEILKMHDAITNADIDLPTLFNLAREVSNSNEYLLRALSYMVNGK